MSARQALSISVRLRKAVSRQFAIAKLFIQMETIETRAKTRIKKINEDKTARLDVLKRRVQQYIGPVLHFFETERGNLASNETGTVAKTEGGKCEWYPGANSIEVHDESAAIAVLKSLGFKDALRIKTELNKEYLLEHPEIVEKVSGIEIVQKPKRVFSFEGTKVRAEISDDTGQWVIVFPKKKQ